MNSNGNNIIAFASRTSRQDQSNKQNNSRSNKRKLLCLTDSAKASENLVKTLDSIFEIKVAATVFNAAQSLKTDIPSGLIVQMHLKDENCFDFLRMLSSNVTFARIPIITCCVDDVFDKSIEDYLIKATRVMGSDLYISCAEFYSETFALKVTSALDSRTVPLAS